MKKVHYFSFSFYVVPADGDVTDPIRVWQQGDACRTL